MKKRFIIALILLVLFSTYKIQDSLKFRFNHNIKNISVENNSILNDRTIIEKLSFLYETNLFFLSKKNINSKLSEIELIESYEIKKIYPDRIKIKIFEKKPIAILQNKKEKNYYTSNGDVINFFESEKFRNLPVVFSNKDNFKKNYQNLEKINFPFNEIKACYFFESNRWDLITTFNQTLKLPPKNYNKVLINFLSIRDQNNFKKYEIFDYRINGQLILK